MNRNQILIDISNCILISIAGFIVACGIFKPGVLIAFDHPTHFAEMHYLVKYFIPISHWIDGWCMQAPLGQPMLLYTYQLGGWAVALLNLIFKIDLNMSYKILVYISYLATPIALYLFVKARFGNIPGIISSLLFMFQKAHTDLLLGSLWNSYLAMGIFVVFFDLLERNYRDLNIRKAALLAILQGLIILAHPIAHQASLLLLAAVFIISFLRFLYTGEGRGSLFFLIIIPIAGSLVSFYYLYNLLATHGWLGGTIGPWLKESFAENLYTMASSIFGGFDKAYKALSFFVNTPELLRSVLGLAGIFLVCRKPEAKFGDFFKILTLFLLFSLFVFSGVWYHIPVLKDLPLINVMINKRLSAYLHLGLCIFAAYCVKRLSGYVRIRTGRRRALAALAGISLVFVISASEHHIVEKKGLTATTESIRQAAGIEELWRWVGKNCDKNSRIVYQSTFENSANYPVLDQSHILALGMYYTPLANIVTCGVGYHYPTYTYVETSGGRLFGKPVGRISEDEITHTMALFNARYLVTLEPVLRRKISAIGSFRAIKEIDNYTIFEYSGPGLGWVDLSDAAPKNHYEIMEFKEDYLKIKVDNLSPGNRMILKVAYHPYWHAYIDGTRQALESGPLGLMKVALPGRGEFLLELKYSSRKTLPALISAAMLALSLLIVIFSRKAI